MQLCTVKMLSVLFIFCYCILMLERVTRVPIWKNSINTFQYFALYSNNLKGKNITADEYSACNGRRDAVHQR